MWEILDFLSISFQAFDNNLSGKPGAYPRKKTTLFKPFRLCSGAPGTITGKKIIFFTPPLNAIQNLLLISQNLVPIQGLLGDSLGSQFFVSGLNGRYIPLSFGQFLYPFI